MFNLACGINNLAADCADPDAEFPACLSINYDESSVPEEICFDRRILRMVFDALIRNAFEAVAPQEALIQITVSSDAESPQCRITVTDNGPGIPPEIRPRVFLPYYSGRNAGRGLGFGLPRSWALMKRTGGKLSLDNDGFVIVLPLSKHE